MSEPTPTVILEIPQKTPKKSVKRYLLWLSLAVAVWIVLYYFVRAPLADFIASPLLPPVPATYVDSLGQVQATPAQGCNDCNGGKPVKRLPTEEDPTPPTKMEVFLTDLGYAIRYFIFNATKMLLLLAGVIFIVGIIRSFFTTERTRQLLGGKREFVGNFIAASLGVVTPFCTCSAIPLFIGFVTAGVPLGVTFSFLVSAPMVNEVALGMLFGQFGWQVAVIYLVSGFSIAVVSGYIIGKLKLEKWVVDWVYAIKTNADNVEEERLSFTDRIDKGVFAVKDIMGKVWPYVLIGLALGSIITIWVPENFFAGIMGKTAWWSVPAAVAVGIPMYSNPGGILPVVQALLEKGAALGTALAFMMAVIGLSLPEIIILRQVLKAPLIGVFVGVVAVGILIVGYLFNIIL